MRQLNKIIGFLLLTSFIFTDAKAFQDEGNSTAPNVRSFAMASDNVGAVNSSVNLFTGKVNLPINLLSISGRNGMDVSVSLLYNNTAIKQQVETWNLDSPTGIVGLGWSLGFERIVVDNKNTGSKHDDVYYLLGGGGSTRLVNLGVENGVFEYATENYQFWKIYYYPNDERWEITKEDGSKSIYGGGVNTQDGQKQSNGQSVQWGVKWGNWIGSSVLATGQEQYASAWNLHKTKNLYGDSIQFDFRQVQQYVGSSSGKLYTQAVYLDKIVDVYGREVRFQYGQKYGAYCPDPDGGRNAIEYQEQHVIDIEDTVSVPDAYQDRFEKEYLSSIEVTDFSDNTILTIELEYSIAGTGTLAKRILTSLTHRNSVGESLPNMQFVYEDSLNVKGNLKKIIYPHGMEVIYNYDSVTISRSDRDFLVNSVVGFEKPRVFVGEDYVVVTQYRNTPRQLRVEVFTWDGEWVSSGPVYTTSNVEILDDIQDFEIFTGSGFFAMIERYSRDSGDGTKYAIIFQKNETTRGGWHHHKEELGSNSKNPSVAIGNRYFAIAFQSNLRRFTLKSEYQIPIYESIQYGDIFNNVHPLWGTPINASYSITGHENYIIAYRYESSSIIYQIGQTVYPYDAMRVLYIGESGSWDMSTEYNTNKSIGKPSWYPGQTMALMRDEDWRTTIINWDSNFNSVQFTDLNNSTNSSFNPIFTIVNNSMIGVATRANTSTGAVLGRFDGSEWKFKNFGNQLRLISIGDDYGLKMYKDGTTYGGYRVSYDANTNQWLDEVISDETFSANLSGEGPKPRANIGMYSMNEHVYRRNTDNSWSKIGLLPLAPNKTMDQHHNIYQGSNNYTVYELSESTGPTTSMIYSYGSTIYNGQLTEAKSIEGTYVQYIGAARNIRKDNFGYNVMALPTPGYDSDSVMLQRLVDHQFSGNQSDIVVSRYDIANGIDTSFTHITYEASTAAFDPSGATSQFHQVTVSNTSSNDVANYGSTRHIFYNGLNASESVVSHSLDFRLKGIPYATEVLDHDGNRVSLSQDTQYEIIPVSLNSITSGWYARLKTSESTVDGIKTTTTNSYNPDNGMMASSETKIRDGTGVLRTHRTEHVYFHEKYPTVSESLNLLTPVVQTISKVDATIISTQATKWKDWGGNIGWLPHKSAVWDGTGVTTNVNWTSTGAFPTNWIQTSEITKRHSVYGWVQESKDIYNITSTSKWSSNPQQLVASFSNAVDNSTIADNFDRLVFGNGPILPLQGTHSWQLYNGSLRWTSTTTHGVIAAIQSVTQTNFIAEYDVYVPAHATSTNWGGLHFRKTNASHTYSESGYVVRVRRDGKILLTKGLSTSLGAAVTIPNFSLRNWHRIQVHAEGSLIRIFVNGEKLIEAVDTSFTGTYIGFYAYQANVQFDNLIVHPIDAFGSVSGYDPIYGHGISQSGGGSTTRALFDTFQRPVAAIGSDGIAVSTTATYLSRELNANYNASDPNVSHSTSIMGTDGYYDDFSTPLNRWASSGSNSTWTVLNGRLLHANQGGGTNINSDISSLRLDLGKNYTGRVVIEMDLSTSVLSGSTNPNFGIGMGSESWNYGNSATGNAVYAAFSQSSSMWQLSTFKGSWTTVKSGLKPSQTYRIKIVADLETQKSSYYVNGVPVAYNQNFRGSNIQSIRRIALLNSRNGSVTQWVIDNIVVYSDPIHSISYIDGSGRPRQNQSEEENAVIVSAVHYDGIGRGVVATRTVRLNGEWFGYKSNFSIYDWSAHTMTGTVATIYSEDSGYPFSRTRYETTPLRQLVESGRPSQLFSIGEKTAKMETFSNRNDGFMDYLPVGQYRQSYTEDADGKINTAISDLGGNVLAKARVSQKPVFYQQSQIVNGLIQLNSANFFNDEFESGATGNASFTIDAMDCMPNGQGGCLPYPIDAFTFKVGTQLGYDDVYSNTLIPETQFTGQFPVLSGNTYYISFTSNYNMERNVQVNFQYQYFTDHFTLGTYEDVTTYEYDIRGNLTKIYPPNYYNPPTGTAAQFVSEFQHDHFGRVVWQKDPDAGISRSIYDRKGRLRFSQGAENAIGNQFQDAKIQYTKYDALGRITESGYIIQSWNQGTLQTNAENPTWPTTPVTWRVKNTYGTIGTERGTLVKVEVNNDSDNTADVIETWHMDNQGRVVSKGTEVIGQGPTAFVTYQHDNLGNVTEMLYPENTPLVITEIHVNSAYDQEMDENAGEYIEVTNISDHTVDLKGWTLRDIGVDSDQYFTVATSHVLAPGSSAVFANNHNGSYANGYGYSFDFDLSSVWHRLRLQNWPTDDVIALQDPSGRSVDWIAWNGVIYAGTTWPLGPTDDESISFHRKTVVTGPGLAPTPSQWEAAPRDPYLTTRLTSVTRRGDVVYSYNRLGQVASVGTHHDQDFYAAYNYNANGSMSSEKLHPTGVDSTEVDRIYTYNSVGWLTGIGGDYFNQSLTYTSGGYGGDSYHNGYIASSTYSYSWANDSLPAPIGYTYTYRYDSRGQLVTADNSQNNHWDVGVGSGNTLQYDPNGNITRFNEGIVTRTYTYTAGTNRFASSSERLNNYDATGRIVSIEGHMQGYQTFQIDPYWGKATYVSGQQTAAYRYGAASQRVQMMVDPDVSNTNPLSTNYIHGLGDQPLVERRNYGAHPVTRYVYGPSGLLAIHEDEEGTVWFPLKDNLGSTRVMLRTEQVSGVRQVYPAAVTDYMPFGDPMRWSGTGAGRFGFTGQEYDPETDLYNYKARLYSTDTGQFLSPDPAGQFHSPYVGMGNNPVNLVDPDGEFAIEAAMVLAFVNYRQGSINSARTGEHPNKAALRGMYIGAMTGGTLGPSGGITVGQYLLKLGVSMFPSPDIPLYKSKNFSLSLSPSLALGTEGLSLGPALKASANLGEGYKISGGMSHIFNLGTNDLNGLWNNDGYEGRYSWRASYEGYTVGSTQFTGQYPQRVGLVGFDSDRYSFFHENDVFPFIGDEGDKYRTAAIYGSAKIDRHTTVSFGAYLLTGDPQNRTTDIVNRQKTYNNERTQIRSGIYFGGIKYKGNSVEFGGNSEAVRAFIQNGWHTAMGYKFLKPVFKGPVPHFEVKDYPSRGYNRDRHGYHFSIY